MTGLPLICVEALIAPKLAKLHGLKHFDAMKRLCQDAAAISLLATSPAILFMIFPQWAMVIFDDSYMAAAPVLAILMVGQFANAALGSVGLCLTMSGHGPFGGTILDAVTGYPCRFCNLARSPDGCDRRSLGHHRRPDVEPSDRGRLCLS